jgi:hypothetical protein
MNAHEELLAVLQDELELEGEAPLGIAWILLVPQAEGAWILSWSESASWSASWSWSWSGAGSWSWSMSGSESWSGWLPMSLL